MLTLVFLISTMAAFLNRDRVTDRIRVSVSGPDSINKQFSYQLLVLGVAILVLSILYMTQRTTLEALIGMGEIAAPAKAVPWLGLGISLSFIVTLAVLAFVFVRFRRTIESLGQVIPFVPWVVLFSITNSLSEEVIYRLGVVVPLLGVVDTGTVLLVSAAAFGLAHVRGMPNGMLGMLMAGFLGWLLAKSVVETNGVFWAWGIHFLQDMVIFSALIMAAAHEQHGRASPT